MYLRQRSHYSAGIENATVFLLLGPPSTLVRHEDGAFEYAPQAEGIRKRRVFVFVWTENILKTEFFGNDSSR